MDCIFCKIGKKEIPASIVFEDTKVIAFLDINPAVPHGGHVLIIPKKHSLNLNDTAEEDLSAAMKVVKKVAAVLMKEHDGVNIMQNNGKAAGQVVEHLHFHVIPRKTNDGVHLGRWQNFKYEGDGMKQMQERIKKLL